jgi:hypothetical protein
MGILERGPQRLRSGRGFRVSEGESKLDEIVAHRIDWGAGGLGDGSVEHRSSLEQRW